MSELSVGQLKGLTVNSNIITVPTGHKLYAPGSVVQVQTSQLTSKVSQSVGTASDGVSFMSVNITPKFATSKMVIQFFVNGSSGDTARYQNFGISTYRNSVKIGLGDSVGTTTRVTSSFWGTNTDSAASSMISGTVIDSPGTTSVLTYDIRPVNVRGDGASTIYINGPSRTDSWTSSSISTLVVWEVAQ